MTAGAALEAFTARARYWSDEAATVDKALREAVTAARIARGLAATTRDGKAAALAKADAERHADDSEALGLEADALATIADAYGRALRAWREADALEAEASRRARRWITAAKRYAAAVDADAPDALHLGRQADCLDLKAAEAEALAAEARHWAAGLRRDAVRLAVARTPGLEAADLVAAILAE